MRLMFLEQSVSVSVGQGLDQRGWNSNGNQGCFELLLIYVQASGQRE